MVGRATHVGGRSPRAVKTGDIPAGVTMPGWLPWQAWPHILVDERPAHPTKPPLVSYAGMSEQRVGAGPIFVLPALSCELLPGRIPR